MLWMFWSTSGILAHKFKILNSLQKQEGTLHGDQSAQMNVLSFTTSFVDPDPNRIRTQQLCGSESHSKDNNKCLFFSLLCILKVYLLGLGSGEWKGEGVTLVAPPPPRPRQYLQVPGIAPPPARRSVGPAGPSPPSGRCCRSPPKSSPSHQRVRTTVKRQCVAVDLLQTPSHLTRGIKDNSQMAVHCCRSSP